MKKKLSIILMAVMLLMCSMSVMAATTYKDGTYNVNTTLTGSSHGAAIEGTTLTVSGGSMTAKITFRSKKLTWLKLNGTTYTNEGTIETTNSVFTIPIEALDKDFGVTVETVAMSKPYEIDYTLNISSAGVPTADTSSGDNTKPETKPETNAGTSNDTPVVIAPAPDTTPSSSQEATTEASTVEQSTAASSTAASSTAASSTEASKEAIKDDNGGSNGTMIAIIVVVVVVVVGAAIIAVMAKKKIQK